MRPCLCLNCHTVLVEESLNFKCPNCQAVFSLRINGSVHLEPIKAKTETQLEERG